MVSHRRPKPAGRTRVTLLTATAAAAVALSSQAAQADPEPTVKDVKSRVETLNEQAEAATEQYDGARERQSVLQSEVDDLQNKVAREQEALNKLAQGFGTMASAQYRSGGIDPTVQLLLSADPDDYLAKASMLDQLSTTRAAGLKQIETQKRVLDQERSEAAAKMKQLTGAREDLAQKKKDVQGKLAEARKLLNSLSAQQRQSMNAGSLSDPDLGSTPAASGRASSALSAAATRRGDPYVWGATGPSSFDCSGLTQWAYASAGVSIPRTSQEQANFGTRVSRSQLRPGDLVFFFGDLHHVGLYAGNGVVLHAPKTGDVVKYESMDDGYLPFQFGVRV